MLQTKKKTDILKGIHFIKKKQADMFIRVSRVDREVVYYTLLDDREERNMSVDLFLETTAFLCPTISLAPLVLNLKTFTDQRNIQYPKKKVLPKRVLLEKIADILRTLPPNKIDELCRI